MVWYSYLLKNFPQFIMIHTVKGFGIVNKAEIDVFLELSCFFNDPTDVGNLISLAPLSMGFSRQKYWNGVPLPSPVDCVDHHKLWKILQEIGIPEPLTCLLKNLCAGQEATVRTAHETTD